MPAPMAAKAARKLHDDPTEPVLIRTEPGVGYRSAEADTNGACNWVMRALQARQRRIRFDMSIHGEYGSCRASLGDTIPRAIKNSAQVFD